MGGEALAALLRALYHWQRSERLLEQSDGRIVLLAYGGRFLPLCLIPEGRALVPEGARVAFELSLCDIPARLTQPLNTLFEGDDSNGE
jgi:hypothetical protein